MKKRLSTLQTLAIAFAVLVSFGLATFHAVSEAAHAPQSAQAEQSSVFADARQLDFNGHGNAGGGQHTHLSECCGHLSRMPIGALAVSPDTPWRADGTSPPAFSTGPPVRPPRVLA